MNGNYRYEVRGSQALACRYKVGEEDNLIDYDVARRSYEARIRLARRQQQAAEDFGGSAKDAGMYAKERLSLTRVARVSYTPERTSVDAVAELAHKAAVAVSEHPFVDQLKHGSIEGRQMGNITYRQAFSTGAICMALSAVLIFVGM